LGRLGGVLGASWSVLGRLGGVMKRLEALLKAIWPDAENIEKPLVFLAFSSLGRSWKRLRGLLERL
jgi:2-hydroxychromene-2-carboxylate isomerase